VQSLFNSLSADRLRLEESLNRQFPPKAQYIELNNFRQSHEKLHVQLCIRNASVLAPGGVAQRGRGVSSA